MQAGANMGGMHLDTGTLEACRSACIAYRAGVAAAAPHTPHLGHSHFASKCLQKRQPTHPLALRLATLMAASFRVCHG